jgi:hypothetical protein
MYRGVAYHTALQAAQAMCRLDYPRVDSISATSTVLTSCTSADQAGLTGDLVRLNLVRASSNAAPTTVAVQTRIPQGDEGAQHGGSLDPVFWALCVVVLGLGYIGGRLR